MLRPRAVLFDLDGVLVDSVEAWFRLQDALAVALGYPALSRARFRESFGQSVEADIRSFYPGANVGEVAAYYDAHFMDHAEHLRVTEGAPELLERLRRAGLPTAVVTNTATVLARRIATQLRLVTDALIGTSDGVQPKPAPDMVLLAAERLGVTPAEAVLVGDSRYDREAASAAGARFIGYGIDGDVRVERLEQVAAWVGA